MPRPIHLAVVAGYPPDNHGEAHYSAQVYNLLAEENPGQIRISVYAHLNPEAKDPQDHPHLTVHRVTGGQTRTQKKTAVARLAQKLLADKPDIVHLQGTTTAHYGGLFGEPNLTLVRQLRQARVPAVLTLHSTWSRQDLDRLWKSKKLPAPARALLTAHYARFHRSLARELAQFRILVSGKQTPTFAEYTAENRLPAHKTVEEPHACDLDPVHPDRQTAALAKLTLPSDKPLVFAGGFIRPDKGLHHLVQALLDQPHIPASLVIAGKPSGPEGEAYAAQLQNLARPLLQSGQARLVFRFLDDQELADHFDAATIVVVPYARAVGASGPVHHAIGRGKTVLATNTGQNRGLDGIAVLFKPDDPASLAQALAQALTDPQAQQEKVLAYAAQTTWRHLADDYLQTYESILAQKPLSRPQKT